MDDNSETPLVKKPKKTDNKNNNTHDMNDDNENNDNDNNNDDNIHTQNTNNKNENNSLQHLSSQTELDSDFTLADVVVTHKQNKEITLQQIIDRVYV